MMPQSPSRWAPWDLTQFSQPLFHCSKHSQNLSLESPSPASWYFPESHRQSEIASLLKMILVLAKARSRRAPNLGHSGAESPGWFDVNSLLHSLSHLKGNGLLSTHFHLMTSHGGPHWLVQLLFMHACSSPLSLAASLHRRHANRSRCYWQWLDVSWTDFVHVVW